MLVKLYWLGYTESYSETQNHKYCFINSRIGDDAPDTSGTLDTLWKQPMIRPMMRLQLMLHLRINQWWQAVKVKCWVMIRWSLCWLEKQPMPSLSFVGDNIDIVKYCLYFPWKQSLLLDGLNQGHLSSTTFARSTDNRSCLQGEVEALGKVKARQS